MRPLAAFAVAPLRDSVWTTSAFERIDVVYGSSLAGVIGFVVVVACAATLHVERKTITSASAAAAALEERLRVVTTPAGFVARLEQGQGAVRAIAEQQHQVSTSHGLKTQSWRRGLGWRVGVRVVD